MLVNASGRTILHRIGSKACFWLPPGILQIVRHCAFWHGIRGSRVCPRAFLHLLDPVELRRLVHNARFIATNSRTLTPLTAFGGILIKRYEQAGMLRKPYFRFHVTVDPINRLM